MNIDDKADKQLEGPNHRMQDGGKRDEEGVVKEQQHLVDDDQLNDNIIAKDVKDVCEEAVQASAVLQMSQQQPQGAMVCWERFLHLRSLKVLLVENDDSSRHVVAAPLRNCCYEVTEVTNGLQAWKILENLTNHIDLVLTEVALPCLSGIALLSKIMSHKTRKNLPVIMMSSLDAVGLVFKCLSKGAVDFLVKPIRKNELKNLWLHAWRRCHSSSGSGSESGTQTHKSVKSKNVEKSDNNTGSNDEDDNGSIDLNLGDGSDDGSGTQSSWTKQAEEVDNPRLTFPYDQVAECPDSTCAQVIHSNAEIAGNRMVPVTAEKECQEHEEQCENVAKHGQDLDVGAHRSLDLQLEYQTETPIKLVGTKQTKQLETGSSKFSEKIDREQLNLNSESPSCKLKYEGANLASSTNKITYTDGENTEYEASNKHSRILDLKSKAVKDSKELPSLERSLKKHRGTKDIETKVQDLRNVLRRSDSSAFSRYNAASNANKGPCGKIESASQVNNNLEVTKKGSECDIQSYSNGDPLNQSSNGGSNNMDMGSTTNNAFIKLQVLSVKRDDLVGSSVQAQPRNSFQELHIQHLKHQYDCHHPVHSMQQQLLPHNGSSHALGGFSEGNAGNYCVNGSVSGSNHGSNGQNGSSTAVNAGRMIVESDNRIAGKSGRCDAGGSGSGSWTGNRVDQSKFAQREAALTKFRQKRKERCFRNKVRYESRKMLAEHRPRIRGQFVRQTAKENTSNEAER